MSDNSFTISLKFDFSPSWYSIWSSLISRSFSSSAMLHACMNFLWMKIKDKSFFIYSQKVSRTLILMFNLTVASLPRRRLESGIFSLCPSLLMPHPVWNALSFVFFSLQFLISFKIWLSGCFGYFWHRLPLGWIFKFFLFCSPVMERSPFRGCTG